MTMKFEIELDDYDYKNLKDYIVNERNSEEEPVDMTEKQALKHILELGFEAVGYR